MPRIRRLLGAVLVLAFCGLALAEPVPLVSANGIIDKVDSETVTIRPRGADGKFEKAITLKLTGTSTFTKVGTRKSSKSKGKVVIQQKSVKSKDLEPKQAISIIYTTEGGTPTLLSGVVQPAE